MGSMKITFQSRSFVQAAKLQQQVITQMKPLGYVLDNVEVQPISEKKIETKITLVTKKETQKTP